MGKKQADALQAKKKLFFPRAPKLGNGKSPLSFSTVIYTLEIGKKIGGEKERATLPLIKCSGLMLQAVGLITNCDYWWEKLPET